MENIAAAAERLKKAYQKYIDANFAYNKSIGMRPSLALSTIHVKMPPSVRGPRWKTKRIK